MDCPGAVSVSASKAVLGFSKSIVVDVSETAGLPALIKNAYRTGGASIPIVIFTDPGVTQIFGRYDHPAMKSQKYGTIFKPARDGVAKAKKDGNFSGGGKPVVVIKVQGGKVESWNSSAGTEIKAKLVAIEDEKTYLFVTEAGKKIRATAAQLDETSVTKARKLAGLK
ncbi:hypothetical protein OAF68_04200 [Akkermansiaceae bacterium]|nr:hypothetical protein [Akkermansiaceae bacterium]